MGYHPGKRHVSDSVAILNNEQMKQVLQLRVDGHTLKECAARVGISVAKCVRLIARHLSDNPSKQIEEYRAAELEKYDSIERRLLKKVDKAYVKITARPVVKLDEHGEPVMRKDPRTGLLEPVMTDRVPDDGGQNDATALLLKLWDRRAKLLGLDRPVLKTPEGEKPPEHPPERDVELVRAAIRQMGLTRMTRTEEVSDAVMVPSPAPAGLASDPILRQ